MINSEPPDNHELIIPHPTNQFFKDYQERCNNATKYFIWLERRQKKFRRLMNRYPLFSRKNGEIIKRLKKDLPEMENEINPLRTLGYTIFQTPDFNFEIKSRILALFASQHHAHFALIRINLLEDEYNNCLDNYHKIREDNKYLYNKNVSFLSIGIAILSILIALFTVFSGIFIETNLNFSIF